MAPIWHVLILSAFVGPAAATSVTKPPAYGPNLIINPSMEVDENQDGWPDGWRTSKDVEYRSATTLGEHPYTIEGSPQAHSGNRCLHYRAVEVARQSCCSSAWWDLGAWLELQKQRLRTWAIPVISPTFPVDGERDYLLSMWVKAKGARVLHLKFVGHYAGLPETKTHWTQPLLKSPDGQTHMDGSWDWRQFKTRLFVPGGQEWGRLEVWVWQDGEPCELWVDDVLAQLVLKGGDGQ